jgi:hypothetical protein
MRGIARRDGQRQGGAMPGEAPVLTQAVGTSTPAR